jgi:hypothetical protein
VDYTHDIFISYRRDPEVVLWINEHLVPLLRTHVGYELPNPPDIYTDQRLESGATWPVELGTELAQSKVLISLWSGNYLHSQWCTLELSHMVAREKEEQRRTPKHPFGIVLFIIVIDGENIPHELQAIQKVEIQNFFFVRMLRTSLTAEKLEETLKKSAPGIALAIQNAPQFKANWPEQTAKSFFDKFHQQDSPSQSTVPQFT